MHPCSKHFHGGLKCRPEPVPAVRGDLRGLVDLLVRLQGSEALLAVDELRASCTPGPGGAVDVITVSIGLHGYARSPEADG